MIVKAINQTPYYAARSIKVFLDGKRQKQNLFFGQEIALDSSSSKKAVFKLDYHSVTVDLSSVDKNTEELFIILEDRGYWSLLFSNCMSLSYSIKPSFYINNESSGVSTIVSMILSLIGLVLSLIYKANFSEIEMAFLITFFLSFFIRSYLEFKHNRMVMFPFIHFIALLLMLGYLGMSIY
ncbi:MAG: hypothetical protein N4A45_04230 [Flavobacteriales bacterium]|jgi:hypothetical protein|nr:hypothetical protein [Flavobacteriales bacterium]